MLYKNRVQSLRVRLLSWNALLVVGGLRYYVCIANRYKRRTQGFEIVTFNMEQLLVNRA
jgi:hypothetical protein